MVYFADVFPICRIFFRNLVLYGLFWPQNFYYSWKMWQDVTTKYLANTFKTPENFRLRHLTLQSVLHLGFENFLERGLSTLHNMCSSRHLKYQKMVNENAIKY